MTIKISHMLNGQTISTRGTLVRVGQIIKVFRFQRGTFLLLLCLFSSIIIKVFYSNERTYSLLIVLFIFHFSFFFSCYVFSNAIQPTSIKLLDYPLRHNLKKKSWHHFRSWYSKYIYVFGCSAFLLKSIIDRTLKCLVKVDSL